MAMGDPQRFAGKLVLDARRTGSGLWCWTWHRLLGHRRPATAGTLPTLLPDVAGLPAGCTATAAGKPPANGGSRVPIAAGGTSAYPRQGHAENHDHRRVAMKTRAAVMHEMQKPRPYAKSRPLVIEELDLDPPGEGEVLVRIRAAGLCHSDLSTINGDRPRQMPMVLGHEAAGEVLELGPRRQGSRRSATTSSWCSCRAAATACRAWRGGRRCASRAPRPTAPARCSRARRPAAARAASRSTTTSASRPSPSMPSSRAIRSSRSTRRCRSRRRRCSAAPSSPAPAPSSTRRRCSAGTSVAVVGLGGVGLMAMLAARLAGCRQIIAIDMLDDKLKLARQLGATHTVNAGAARRHRAGQGHLRRRRRLRLRDGRARSRRWSSPTR